MKSQTHIPSHLDWQSKKYSGGTQASQPVSASAVRASASRICRLAIPTLASALVVTAIMVVSLWAAGAATQLLAASVSLSGLVFLAVAVDQAGWRAALLAATGITLPALGLLSAKFSPELGVVGSALVSQWLVFTILDKSSNSS